MEEHFISGGIGESIARLILENQFTCKYRIWGIAELPESEGSYEFLLKLTGLDENTLKNKLENFMQALVIRNENGKCVPYLENVDVPECKENEVLIEVQKVGICGSDFHLFTPRGFPEHKVFLRLLDMNFPALL